MFSFRTSLLRFVLPASVLFSVGCKEEETTPALFEEDGTWSMQEWAEDGSGFVQLNKTEARKDAFMIRYSRDKGVVAAAACSSPVGDEDFSPASSLCRTGDTDEPRIWDCQCYSYDWQMETTQIWLHYKPSDGLPPNPNTADPEDTTVVYADTGSVANSIRLTALPTDLFDSNGESSSYIFQLKADSLFDETECWDECVRN